MRNIFAELSQINVNDHIEKKMGLSYLSWAWAEAEIKKRFPMTTFDYIPNPNPVQLPIRIDLGDGNSEVVHVADERLWPAPVGATVKTITTVTWQEEDGMHSMSTIDMLPVMDMKNKAIPINQIDANNVNKTLQRSWTKGIAMHGLGFYVYQGEDLPEISDDTKAEIATVKTNLEKVINAKVANMSSEEKVAFANEIEAVLGTKMYKKCDDLEKLKALYNKINK